MMIAQTKPPHPRWLEGNALLVHSTPSCHFATIRFATPRNAAFDRSGGLWDRPFGFGQPTARPIRFGSPRVTINTRGCKKPHTHTHTHTTRGADRDDDGEADVGGGRRVRDDPRGDRADLHHDRLQEQVLGPLHRRGLFALRVPSAELGEREEML
jgi:hypothetical protein